MSKYRLLLLMGLSLGLFFYQSPSMAYANESSTVIGIEITEPELYLERVTTPIFQIYETSSSTIQAVSIKDLAINVIDKRVHKSSWSLRYSLSVFENETGAMSPKDFVYTLDKGRLTGRENQSISEEHYDSRKIKQYSGASAVLLVVDSQESAYQYMLENKQITIEIAANVAAGRYQAVQTVLLEHVPEHS